MQTTVNFRYNGNECVAVFENEKLMRIYVDDYPYGLWIGKKLWSLGQRDEAIPDDCIKKAYSHYNQDKNKQNGV